MGDRLTELHHGVPVIKGKRFDLAAKKLYELEILEEQGRLMELPRNHEYVRILEILRDYWLTEKEELEVEVIMKFKHANGETQEKCVTWHNPNYPVSRKPDLISARELLTKPILIDANGLVRDMKDWQGDIHDNEYDAKKYDFVFERIYEIVNEQPIAYDMDKVAEQLKWYLDTNEERGVVYIPKFVIEEIVKGGAE